MADGVNEPQSLVRASDEHAASPPLAVPMPIGSEGGGTSSPHAGKFRAATALLIGIAIGAIVIALAALIAGGHGSSQQWSEWAPSDGGSQGAHEIADHIAPLYRISGTQQLAVVTVANLGNPAAAAASANSNGSSGAAGLQVAVRADPSTSAVSLIGGHTVAYNLCGLGSSNCSIGIGTPSPDRLLLLRREALELALYTFKYISGTQNVVAILPPGHTQPPSTLTPKPPSSKTTTPGKPVDVALLFLHDELQPLLSQPLSATLPEQFPPTIPELGLWKQTPEAALVEQLTGRGMFSEHVTTTQDGSSLIVLDPMPPQ